MSGSAVRPTPDRLREALFNVLSPKIAGKVFLDVYAGSGAVGIEAVSRGASKAILIEKSREALKAIEENLASLGLGEKAIVARGDAARVIPRFACDIAFLDPPYDRLNEYGDAMSALDKAECPLVIAQHESRLVMNENYGALRRVRVLRQGSNSLSFFERNGGV